jgi:hypothetical protein
VPVLKVSAARGQGLEALWRTLEELPSRRDAGTTNERALLRQAQQLLAERFHLRPGAAREVVDRWGRGLVAGPAAAEALIRALIEEPIE